VFLFSDIVVVAEMKKSGKSKYHLISKLSLKDLSVAEKSDTGGLYFTPFEPSLHFSEIFCLFVYSAAVNALQLNDGQDVSTLSFPSTDVRNHWSKQLAVIVAASALFRHSICHSLLSMLISFVSFEAERQRRKTASSTPTIGRKQSVVKPRIAISSVGLSGGSGPLSPSTLSPSSQSLPSPTSAAVTNSPSSADPSVRPFRCYIIILQNLFC